MLATFPLDWPEFVTKFFNALTIINFSVDLFQPECAIGDGNIQYISVWLLKVGCLVGPVPGCTNGRK